MPVNPKNLGDKRSHKNSVLVELRRMERIAFERVSSPECDDAHVAQLMRAYVAAEQQRNVLKMRPAPKPVSVPAPGDRKRKRQADEQSAMIELPPTETTT